MEESILIYIDGSAPISSKNNSVFIKPSKSVVFFFWIWILKLSLCNTHSHTYIQARLSEHACGQHNLRLFYFLTIFLSGTNDKYVHKHKNAHSFSSDCPYCVWLIWGRRVWLIPSSGHIWYGLYYTPLGQWELPTIIPVQVQRSPTADPPPGSAHGLRSLQAGHRMTTRGGGVLWFFFVSVWGGAPVLTQGRPYPVRSQSTTDSIVCRRVSVSGQCIYERVRGCVGVCASKYKGQSLSMAHWWWNLIWQIRPMMGGGTSNCVSWKHIPAWLSRADILRPLPTLLTLISEL